MKKLTIELDEKTYNLVLEHAAREKYDAEAFVADLVVEAVREPATVIFSPERLKIIDEALEEARMNGTYTSAQVREHLRAKGEAWQKKSAS